MNKNSLILLILLITAACSVTEERLMEPVSTVMIDEDDTKDSIRIKAAHVVPTANQYEALKNEFIAFIHFGPNTFTRKEWGNGMEDPAIFALEELDTDQWCSAMKDAGMKMVIITVKHHDGFVLWQSRYTDHGIMSTSFQDGKGDILKELSKSCEKYGLKLGVYLSPADLYQIEHPEGLYGNLSEATERVIPRPVEGRPFSHDKTFTFKVDDYNEYFLNQLYELLTEYGPIHEVWFDGAHPKRKGGQQYDYLAWEELISTLAPEAVIFGRRDVRWCGNESGATRDVEWNIIPYMEDPNLMNNGEDMVDKDLGSLERLYEAKYLHYQQAETNTSIREGWFYRDDENQKTRNADDVFDIYERSVGGNSTFLLNIPPNRQGRFADEDVAVLKEVGNRIRETYTIDLFAGANGPKQVLDGDAESFVILEEGESIQIELPEPQTINRVVLQEDISKHGERVESHILEAWINGQWEEVARAGNIGYKRILRFPEVTSERFRIRVTDFRLEPAIALVSAHYYQPRPPQVTVSRNTEGLITILPEKHEFGWKPHGQDAGKNLNDNIEIRYTTDGSEPGPESALYEAPFNFGSGQIKAAAFVNNQQGSTAIKEMGVVKTGWEIAGSGRHESDHTPELAIDGIAGTYWMSENDGSEALVTIDLGSVKQFSAFGYTPPENNPEGMIEKGLLKISNDGKTWSDLEEFEFGNLINDPVQRIHYFKKPAGFRYLRIKPVTIAGGYKRVGIAEIDLFE